MALTVGREHAFTCAIRADTYEVGFAAFGTTTHVGIARVIHIQTAVGETVHKTNAEEFLAA